MPKIATISRAQLNMALRLDAEHYSPRFIPVLQQLKKYQTIKLRDTLIEPIRTGHTPSMKNSTYYHPGIIKFIKTDNLREDEIDISEVQMLSELGNKQIAASELRPGDVIVTIIGATEDIIGRAACVQPELGRANINQNIALIRSRLPSGFLTVFLNSKYGREQLIWLSRQTGQVNLNCREVEELIIPIFSNTFVRFINELHRKRHDLLRSAIDMYYKAENLLLEELGLKDFKPKYERYYTVNLSEALTVRRIDAEYFQPVYSHLIGYLKRNFKILPLKAFVLDLQKGIEVGSENYREKGKPFFRVSNLSVHGFVKRDQKYIEEELYQKLNNSYEPQIGDLLLTKDATPGIAYVVKEQEKGIISSGILRLKIDENQIDAEYLALYINSIVGKLQIERDSGGSVITHWKPEQIKNLQVPVLPVETQQKIAMLVKQSHQTWKKARELLDEAKRKIEEEIESKS